VASRRRRQALLVGINRYPNMGPKAQLRGCVNDVRAMAEVLGARFGFRDDELLLLEDGAATREAILAALDGLAAGAAKDGLVVVHYSGHGSRMQDREGDEPDGWDETIVPCDSGRPPHPNRDITDDEIYLRLLAIGRLTRYVTLIFDSCFSGTIARDPFAAAVRWLPADPRAVAELPPSPVAAPEVFAGSRDTGPSGWLPASDRYALLAGCREVESAHEIVLGDGEPADLTVHGALTYHLCQELTRARPGATYRDVFERAAARVTTAFPTQHPQLEGARDRELFGVRRLAPMRFLPVVERAGGRVVLGGGAAHGLTVGSQWAIYPPATKRVRGAASRQGLVRVEQVGATSAGAEVLDEREEGRIAPGSRAVEHRHSYGPMRLAVQLEPTRAPAAGLAALRRRIGGSPLLRLAEPEEPSQARVYALSPRGSVAAGDPAPQLGPLGTAVWAVVGGDGGLLMPVVPLSDLEAPARLVGNLATWARYRFVLGLDNPDPASRLSGRVAAGLLRRRGDGIWEPAEPIGGGSEVVYAEGERVAVALTNRHDAPVYLHLLDLGLTGRIHLLYPVAGANDPLAPGRTLSVGVREGEEMELFVPEGFPFLPVPAGAAVRGTEVFKVFATTHPTDLAPLLQDGFQRLGEGLPARAWSPLEDLLHLAWTGQGCRDARPVSRPPAEDWTALTLSFALERRPRSV
jgi:hypothetical protein